MYLISGFAANEMNLIYVSQRKTKKHPVDLARSKHRIFLSNDLYEMWRGHHTYLTYKGFSIVYEGRTFLNARHRSIHNSTQFSDFS